MISPTTAIKATLSVSKPPMPLCVIWAFHTLSLVSFSLKFLIVSRTRGSLPHPAPLLVLLLLVLLLLAQLLPAKLLLLLVKLLLLLVKLLLLLVKLLLLLAQLLLLTLLLLLLGVVPLYHHFHAHLNQIPNLIPPTSVCNAYCFHWIMLRVVLMRVVLWVPILV
jgi:hypothetical protein